MSHPPTLADLCDPEEASEDMGVETLTPAQREWHDNGLVILRGLIPDETIDAYCARFASDAEKRADLIARSVGAGAGLGYELERSRGYGVGTPYLTNAEMRDVAMDRRLVEMLESLLAEPAGLHLNLTGWRSTRRDWHQDIYLSPPFVGTGYAATWIALGDVDSRNGPFEYVPGSHRWPTLSQQKVLAALGEDGSDPDWPWRSEQLLRPLFDAEIERRGAEVRQFHAEKGDCLIWHSKLAHRGSIPKDPDRERRALISHWSVLSRRLDMPHAHLYDSAHAHGYMFELGPIT